MSEATAVVDDLPDDGTPTTDIVRRAGGITSHVVDLMPLVSDEEMRRLWRVALNLANSRMFKDAFAAEQAFAKILIGRDLGLSPTQSLMAIDLVKGNIQLRGVLVASFIRRNADYEYRILSNTHDRAETAFLGYPLAAGEEPAEAERWVKGETPSDEAVGMFMRTRGRWWEILGIEEFTVTDADRAKLVKDDSNWAKYPKNMCVWRTMSNGAKFHCPDVFRGMPIYVEGELADVPSIAAATAPAIGAGPGDVPDEVRVLVEQAAAIDASVWRVNEIAARLPLATDAGYADAVKVIVAEIETWLAEHEPAEAEVVDAEPAPDADGVEQVDVPAALQERWEQDAEWRAIVEPMLHAQADLESSLDDAVADADDETAEQLRAKLATAEADLDALGVPAGWWPAEPATEAAVAPDEPEV